MLIKLFKLNLSSHMQLVAVVLGNPSLRYANNGGLSFKAPLQRAVNLKFYIT